MHLSRYGDLARRCRRDVGKSNGQPSPRLPHFQISALIVRSGSELVHRLSLRSFFFFSPVCVSRRGTREVRNSLDFSPDWNSEDRDASHHLESGGKSTLPFPKSLGRTSFLYRRVPCGMTRVILATLGPASMFLLSLSSGVKIESLHPETHTRERLSHTLVTCDVGRSLSGHE